MCSGKVMEHFLMPRNAWHMPNADGVGCAHDEQCGDKFTLFIRVCEGMVNNASFVVSGSGTAIASEHHHNAC